MTDDQFKELTERLDGLEKKLGDIDKRLGKLEKRLDEHDYRFDKVDQRLDSQTNDISLLGSMFSRMSNGVDGMERRFDTKLDRGNDDLKAHLRKIYSLVDADLKQRETDTQEPVVTGTQSSITTET